LLDKGAMGVLDSLATERRMLMCMELVSDEFVELEPTVMYKVIGFYGYRNPHYASTSLFGKTRQSCLEHGSVMFAIPRFITLAAIGKHSDGGNHVFETHEGAEEFLNNSIFSDDIVKVIVWGKALKFSYKDHRGYATEFLTAAPRYVLKDGRLC
jgi:hypothetical protein